MVEMYLQKEIYPSYIRSIPCYLRPKVLIWLVLNMSALLIRVTSEFLLNRLSFLIVLSLNMYHVREAPWISPRYAQTRVVDVLASEVQVTAQDQISRVHYWYEATRTAEEDAPHTSTKAAEIQGELLRMHEGNDRVGQGLC